MACQLRMVYAQSMRQDNNLFLIKGYQCANVFHQDINQLGGQDTLCNRAKVISNTFRLDSLVAIAMFLLLNYQS